METLIYVWLAMVVTILVTVLTAKEIDNHDTIPDELYHIKEPVEVIDVLTPLLGRYRVWVEDKSTGKRRIVFEDEIKGHPTADKPDHKIYLSTLRNISNQIKKHITR